MEVDLQIENELKDNLVILTTKEKTKNIQDIVSYIKTRRYFVDGLVNDQKLFIPVDHFNSPAKNPECCYSMIKEPSMLGYK